MFLQSPFDDVAAVAPGGGGEQSLQPVFQAADSMRELLGSGIVSLGTIAAVAVGGFIAFMVVRRGLCWMSTALRGSTDGSGLSGNPYPTASTADGDETFYHGAFATTTHADGEEVTFQYRPMSNSEQAEYDEFFNNAAHE